MRSHIISLIVSFLRFLLSVYRRKRAELSNFKKIEKLLDFKVIRNLKESLIINRWIPTQSANKPKNSRVVSNCLVFRKS